MEAISGDIRTWLKGKRKLVKATVAEVREDDGHNVSSFANLVKKVAHLSFYNFSHELMFRGQCCDHREGPRSSQTSLLPSIFRTPGYFTKTLARARFKELEQAEATLCDKASFKGKARVTRYRVLQWALLQHYGIVRTPLLDVTHSLRVACTFSKLGRTDQETYLYVIGIPYLSGCITTSGDQGIQAIRLLSVCPPQALRPHYQEGYLLGEYPDASFHARERYYKAEWDFGRRLICKFVLPPAESLWVGGFDALTEDVLFPATDCVEELAKEIKGELCRFQNARAPHKLDRSRLVGRVRG